MIINNSYGLTPDAVRAESAKSEDQKLKEACQGFESIFMHKLIQIMRNSIQEGGLIQKNNGERFFTDFLDQELADVISKNNTNGLGDILYEQMKEIYGNAENSGSLEAKVNAAEIAAGNMHNEIMIDNLSKVW